MRVLGDRKQSLEHSILSNNKRLRNVLRVEKEAEAEADRMGSERSVAPLQEVNAHHSLIEQSRSMFCEIDKGFTCTTSDALAFHPLTECML